MFCTKCGTEIGDDDRFCKSCGQNTNGATATAAQKEQAAAAVKPAAITYIPGSKISDGMIKHFVGDNADYYIRKWSRGPSYGSWNWAAFCLGPLWYAYRKMYGVVASYYALYLLLGYVIMTDESLDGGIISALAFVAHLAFGITGNGSYWTMVKKKIERILSYATSSSEAKRDMHKIGGISWVSVILQIVLSILLVIICFVLIFVQEAARYY